MSDAEAAEILRTMLDRYLDKKRAALEWAILSLKRADPDPRDLVQELREAVGLFAGALPYSPKQAWDEAIRRVRLVDWSTPNFPNVEAS